MKKTIIISAVFFCCSMLTAQDNQFPEVDSKSAKSGSLILKEGISANSKFENYPKDIITSFGTLVVPENRSKADSRLISLPVMKLHSFNANPKEPIFLLHGGPGFTNLQYESNVWLLENHDVVLVGYRGVDGEVSLLNSEFPESMVTNGDPFSHENVVKLGNASLIAFNRLKSEGTDVDAYNMIEVIDDIESAKNALGYKKINLFGYSYGTRLGYLYGLRYPESINSSILQAVNPPGRFVWEPEQIDKLFKFVAEEWKKNPKCVEKSSDMIITIAEVFATLPQTWNKMTVNQGKVKMMMFMMAYTQKGIAQIFDAFIAAKNGDYSGLAFLCMAYDQLPTMPGLNWGDNFSKAMSSDYDPERDYEYSMDPVGSVIGSPMSKLFGLMNYGGWPIKSIPPEYRKLRYSNVKTLMISGTIDISTPAINGTQMLAFLPNGHQVILDNRGHQDLGKLEIKVYRNLVNTFFQTGQVEDSGFSKIPIDFDDVSPSFQDMAKMMYEKYKKQ